MKMRLFLIPKISTVFIFFFCLQSIGAHAKLKKFDKQFGSFYDEMYIPAIFEFKGTASIINGVLQLSRDTISPDYTSGEIEREVFSSSGRVLLKQPFKLWDRNENSSRVASFNTSFLINIFRINNQTAAEGLTFLISPDLDLPSNSSGEYLGLTNMFTEGESTNKIVAVELDTFKQDFDPDDNHIGIDIHSVQSVKVESLTPHGIILAPPMDIARFYNIWVNYDGIKKALDVYIAEQANMTGSTPPRPKDPILTHNLDLRDVVNQDSYFGFSASTGRSSQLNTVLRWNLTVEYFYKENHHLEIGLGVGLPVVLLFLSLVAWFGYYYRKKWIIKSQSNILGALKNLPGMPRDFKFKVLKKATNNFDEKNKLGEGGFGKVYKGYLAAENLEIAVKWFSRESIKGEGDFLAELTIINRLRHKHLVKLLGWSHKHGKLLLVYEYMPNSSLDRHLFSGPDKEPLSWHIRSKIVCDVASALHYLHNEYEQKVVHRDIKSNNIMLDSSFNARLGDFGLARTLDNEKTSYAEAEGVLGTMGYIAPECFLTGKATQPSDVYAFGAVLLELVCGKRPGTKVKGFQLFVDWVWYLHRDGRILEAVDKRLGDNYVVVEEATRLLLLALACSHPIASERPKTQTIVQVISGSVPAPEVPPFKPAFVWPSAVPIDIDSDTLDTISITMLSNRSEPELSLTELYTIPSRPQPSFATI